MSAVVRLSLGFLEGWFIFQFSLVFPICEPLKKARLTVRKTQAMQHQAPLRAAHELQWCSQAHNQLVGYGNLPLPPPTEVLRLERDACSMFKRVGQATNENTPTSLLIVRRRPGVLHSGFVGTNYLWG